MPELPEVETVARGLRAWLPGRRLESVELRRASVFGGDGAALAALPGATVAAVRRAGKYLVLELDTGRGPRWQLMIHLGMTGRLTLAEPGSPERKHTHAVFGFGERELRFCDPRRFGRIALAAAPAAPGAFATALGIAPGREPLEIGAGEFVELFRGRKSPIKNALMNQRLLRGLGNIYCDEALFRAGIDPRAQSVSGPRLARLHGAVQRVLRQAIAAGGSSISDYVDSNGAPGWFHLRHRVYGRTGLPCPRCRKPIRRVVLAGRSSHFCSACQR